MNDPRIPSEANARRAATADKSWDDARHFINLALQGRRPACSGGERAAYQLALAIRTYAASLDDEAMAGMGAWIGLCERYPGRTKDMLTSINPKG